VGKRGRSLPFRRGHNLCFCVFPRCGGARRQVPDVTLKLHVCAVAPACSMMRVYTVFEQNTCFQKVSLVYCPMLRKDKPARPGGAACRSPG
jgi:hypothetical protein